MKIYFAGSIRGGRDDAGIYQNLIGWLRSYGEVLTEHVGDPALTEKGDDGPTDLAIHQRDMSWLAESDLVVAEVSTPSLGVGYEVGWACSLGKPILCLFRPHENRPLSAMIAGSPHLTAIPYADLEAAFTVIRNFIGQLSQKNP
ncbi:MAG: nucleoside 2-deoxyribosyltransferase [Thermodesulfobacteriota bacterium]